MFDCSAQIANCIHFKWEEFLSCPQWEVACCPPPDIQKNLILVAKKMERIRSIVGGPLIVTSGWRPEKYNELIGGASRSAHKDGLACDFQHPSISADELREKLFPYLEKLKIRMENLPGSSWVHIDLKKPGRSGRYFKP